MSIKDPLKGPFGAAEELWRQDRARRRMIEDAMGSVRFLKDAGDLTRTLALARDLQESGTLAEIRKTMKQNDELFRSMSGLLTPSWMKSIHDTSLAIANQQNDIAHNYKAMTETLDRAVLSTVKALQEQNRFLAAAAISAQWQGQFKTLSEQIAPALETFRGLAEQRAMLDGTLRAAGDKAAADFYRMTSEQALEVEHLVEAIGEAETPEEGTRLLTSALDIIAVMLTGFVQNSRKSLRKFDIFQLMAVLSFVLPLLPRDVPPAQPVEDGQAYSEVVDQVMTLHKKVTDLLAESDRLDEAYVADLPYADLTRRAVFRATPQRGAPVIFKASAGTRLALKETKGRWRLVVFRDPLTESLSQGWVYGDAVSVPT